MSRRSSRSAPAWSNSRRRIVVAVLVDTLVAAVLMIMNLGGPVRVLSVFVFLVLGPGIAVTCLLPFDRVSTELVMAVTISLAFGALLATAASFTGQWHPTEIVTGSAVAVALSLGWAVRPNRVPHPHEGSRAGRTSDQQPTEYRHAADLRKGALHAKRAARRANKSQPGAEGK